MASCVSTNNNGLLRVAEFRAIRVGLGRLHNRDWSLQSEREHGFRWQLDLLALGGRLHASADSSPCCGTDGCAFSASSERADNTTDDRASANFLSRILAP